MEEISFYAFKTEPGKEDLGTILNFAETVGEGVFVLPEGKLDFLFGGWKEEVALINKITKNSKISVLSGAKSSPVRVNAYLFGAGKRFPISDEDIGFYLPYNGFDIPTCVRVSRDIVASYENPGFSLLAHLSDRSFEVYAKGMGVPFCGQNIVVSSSHESCEIYDFYGAPVGTHGQLDGGKDGRVDFCTYKIPAEYLVLNELL